MAYHLTSRRGTYRGSAVAPPRGESIDSVLDRLPVTVSKATDGEDTLLSQERERSDPATAGLRPFSRPFTREPSPLRKTETDVPVLRGPVKRRQKLPWSSCLYIGVQTDGSKVLLKHSKPSKSGRVNREEETWRGLTHERILPFLGSCTIEGQKYLASPITPVVCIMQFVQSSMFMYRMLLREAADGLAYIHDLGIKHGNVCVENILVSSTGEVYLWNFEESIKDSKDADLADDVYSFGFVMLETMTRKRHRLWNSRFRLRRPRPEGFRESDASVWNVALQCWDKNPQNRPSMAEIREELYGDAHSTRGTFSQQYIPAPSTQELPARSWQPYSYAMQPQPVYQQWSPAYAPGYPLVTVGAEVPTLEPLPPLVIQPSLQPDERDVPRTLSPPPTVTFSAPTPLIPQRRLGAPLSEPTGNIKPILAGASSLVQWHVCIPSTRSHSNHFGTRYRTVGDGPCGGGGFSDIWKGELLLVNDAKETVAVKVLRAVRTNDEVDRGAALRALLKLLKREILIWMDLDHPNVAPLVAFTFEPKISLLSPWYPNGTIRAYLRLHPDADKAKLLEDVASGLSYLHSCSPTIIHGDIKSDNVLINAQGSAVLIDFGLSVLEEQVTSTLSSSFRNGGNIRWMAPELLDDTLPKSKKSDIYAFGCLAFEVFSGDLPFKSRSSDAKIILDLARGEKPGRKVDYPHLSNIAPWDVIEACWAVELDSRPDLRYIIVQLGPSGDAKGDRRDILNR